MESERWTTIRDLLVGAVVVVALGGLGWATAPSVRPPAPPGVQAPTVRAIALRSMEDLTLRAEAIRVLGFVGTDRDVALLEELVADPRWTAPAARALIDLLGPEALPILEPHARSRWFAGRRALVIALGHAHDGRSADLLLDLYSTSRELRIVYAAAEALQARKEPRAVELFADAFRRTGDEARRLAAFPPGSPARVVLHEGVRSGRNPQATRAMSALVEVDDPAIAALLVESLDSKDPERRLGALQALGDLHDPGVAPALLAFESRIDSDEEHAAWMGALWAAGSPVTRDRALEVLATAPAGRARAVAQRIPNETLRAMPIEFVELVGRRPGAVGDAIAESLIGAEWQEVPEAVLTLARDRLELHDGWQRADGPTGMLFRHGTPADQARVGAVLDRLADSGDMRALQIFTAIPTNRRTEDHVEALVTLLSHTSELMRIDDVFRALHGHLDDARRGEVALALLDRVAVDSVMRRALAIPEGRAHVERLAQSGTRTEQVAAKTALGEGRTGGTFGAMLSRGFHVPATKELETFEEQVAALSSKDEMTARSAVSALADSKDPRAADQLEATVLGGGPIGRFAASKMRWDVPERAQALVDRLIGDPDPELRILVLDLSGDPGLAYDALSDVDPGVREAAVRHASAVGSSEAAGHILEVLDDESPEVQRAAAESLQYLGGRALREAGDRIEEILP